MMLETKKYRLCYLSLDACLTSLLVWCTVSMWLLFVSMLLSSVVQLYDSGSLEHKKTYKTERPVNSASLSSLKPHVSIGSTFLLVLVP